MERILEMDKILNLDDYLWLLEDEDGYIIASEESIDTTISTLSMEDKAMFALLYSYRDKADLLNLMRCKKPNKDCFYRPV